MITREEFLHLYEKCAAGQCSDVEKLLLDSYEDELGLADNVWENGHQTENLVYNRIWQKLRESRYPASPFKKPNNDTWTRAAAVFLLCTSLFCLMISRDKSSGILTKTSTRQQPAIIKPGGNKAMLTLANGSSIVLNDAQNGKLTVQSGIQVTKAKDGMLVYQSRGHRSLAPAPEMNIISTPRGGQYQLVLNDGTKVWLNAASVLQFPVQFGGKERRVTLSGEAYFEVHKNPSSPFIVHTSGQDVQVFGTHFNVKAYGDEAVKTSLLEGRVNILSAGRTSSLLPGMEAGSNQGSITIREADVAQSIAWKNGFFQFNNSSLREVMQQISRWYDVSISYEGSPPLRQFSGTISRQVPIDEVLAMLSYTGVKFSIRDKQIIVRQ
jgi:transmembrane sensor